MDIRGKKINFLGDSITQGVGVSSVDNCFVSLIAERYSSECRNYGIGGTRIARQKTPSSTPSFDLDFCMRADGMADDADIVFVFGGTNDFDHGDAPIGTMLDRTPDTFYGALHTLYTKLTEKYSGKTVVVATPLHRLVERNSSGTLSQYVSIIKEVAEYYAFPVLDLYATSGIQPVIAITREKYVPDGLHPNDAGHLILADKISAFLHNL
jgi:lysophospholipase L1-like esterase